MNDLVSRQALLDEFEQWQKTDGYSNDEWNLLVDVLNVIKSMPPAPQLSTNLASLGTDAISRQAAINAIDECYCGGEDSCGEPWIYQENAVEAIQMIEPIPPAHEPLTDKEQRIFLAAMGRERKVCKEVDDQYTHEPYEVMLTKVCSEIERKVKAALWS